MLKSEGETPSSSLVAAAENARSCCNFWLPRKRRHCANTPLPSSLFCGNHQPASDDRRAVPCPVDPSHSVLLANLESHAKRCPLVKQVAALKTQPYYSKGVNSGGADGEGFVSSADKRAYIRKLTESQLLSLIDKIKAVHKAVVAKLPCYYLVPDACEKLVHGQVDRNLPYQEKHVLQQASILGNMEAFGMLSKRCREFEGSDVSNDRMCVAKAVVEFGAGRGYLTQMLADCYDITKVFLVERRSYKFKADRSLRQHPGIILERLRIDIQGFFSKRRTSNWGPIISMVN